MTTTPATEPDIVQLPLRDAGEDEYCRAVRTAKQAEMWWWQIGMAPYRGFSLPFADRQGRWLWRAKPQFGWYLDLFTPFETPPSLPLGKAMFGYQYPVPPSQANSLARFNVIHDLTGYDLSRVHPQKRRAVRKGLKNLDIGLLDPTNGAIVEDARIVWNSHVERTGWNKVFDAETFAGHWRPLPHIPGTHVLGARHKQSGLLCAWIIARVIGGTVFLDTVASHTDRLDERPNDALIYALLHNAAATAGVKHANYFLRSSIQPLERFKQSVGFDSTGIPARVHINAVIGFALQRFRPALWKRVHGELTEETPEHEEDNA